MNRTSAYALIALFTLLFVILFGGSSQLAAYRNPAPALMLTSSIVPIPATAFIYLSLPVFLVCAARRLNLAAQWLFFLLLTSELLIASVRISFILFMLISPSLTRRKMVGKLCCASHTPSA